MGMQFGRWTFESSPPPPGYIDRIMALLAPFGPDGARAYSTTDVQLLYCAFHTTKESHRERQPHITASGAVITWDGRLDNRNELMNELDNSVNSCSTDVEIVAAAYERWNDNLFLRLVGDWALSVWDYRKRSLLLSKDPLGTRTLYYVLEHNYVTWCSILDPLVLLAKRPFEISEEYVAGWLAGLFPATHLTPYVGIHAVPPSSSVVIQPGKYDVKHTSTRYWDFGAVKEIRYRTDSEYEERYRILFANAVKRRLRSDRPVLAELSGGMDSSSIVCTADTFHPFGSDYAPRIDTISWYDSSYDDFEPELNELPYLSRVEEKRGRCGFHIDLHALKEKQDEFSRCVEESGFVDGNRTFVATPIDGRPLPEYLRQYAAHLREYGFRVVLSGIGGDEVTGGGVPSPTLELQNLIATARCVQLTRRSNAWAARMKSSRFPLLWKAVRGFLPRANRPEKVRDLSWLRSSYVRRNRRAFLGYPSRIRLFGPLPSVQGMCDQIEAHRRFLAHSGTTPELPREVRYPFLDRDFLEFLCAVPPEQLIGLGTRRYLMKRSLAGIVPEDILRRRQKAAVPRMAKPDHHLRFIQLGSEAQDMLSAVLGWIDQKRFFEALKTSVESNGHASTHVLFRACLLESWLRYLRTRSVLSVSELRHA